MSLDCTNLLKNLRGADWTAVEKTVGNNHNTIIGVLASWYSHISDGGIVIEGAPSFHRRESKPFYSDSLFCQGPNDIVVGILEVERKEHKHTIGKIGRHFDSSDPMLQHLWFAIYVAYSELPKGRKEHRDFPEPLSENEYEEFYELSRRHRKKCIAVISLNKHFEKERSEVRKKSDYYSGRIQNVMARLYRNGRASRDIELFNALG